MITVQEKLQLKREPLDKWSLREQLCLASAVARSGDQNWMSVSRSLKPFGEANRPTDWFHQKNCASQYGSLLGNTETPKRNKKRTESGVVETPAECILKRLLAERQRELRAFLAEEKAEYKKLQDDMKILQAGNVSEEQLDKWCKEIDDEEVKREQEALNHSNWLKQRDLRKLEIERAWRPPIKTNSPTIGQKRKTSEAGEDSNDMDVDKKFQTPETTMQFQQYLTSPQQQRFFQQQELPPQSQEQSKPALSPLLTSLLKSPSQVQNISTTPTSILHCAITGQSVTKPVVESYSTMPKPPDYPDFTNQDSNLVNDDSVQPLNADLLDDANIKIDDLAKSILEDGPFPEIKKEEVDDIISEIIESSQDLVTDPEQHLQLDGNGDIQISLELDDLENVDEEPLQQERAPSPPPSEEPKATAPEKSPAPVVDPFEFQEDPVIFQSPMKPSSLKQDGGQYTTIYQNSPVKSEEPKKPAPVEDSEEKNEPEEKPDKDQLQCSVDIVPEEQDTEPELNKDQIRDIVHSESVAVKEEPTIEKVEPDSREVSEQELDNEESKSTDYFDAKTKDSNEGSSTSLGQSEEVKDEFADDFYDNINMEVKIDKTGKTKRDYSRPKKRDDKNFDMLLAIEKAQLDDVGTSDDGEYKTDKKTRLNSETERSASPWTEEETSFRSNKRRLSMPGTPIDSLPGSPASSVYDDDKDYRNWKKSVTLVYNRLASNKYASLFLKPITDDQAPGYSSVVYRPMDLQTIKKNIDNGILRTSLEFKRDVMLMFTNAIMYNKTNGTVYNMALQMQQESLNPIEILLQADGQVEVPARRETRTSDVSVKRKRLASDVEPVKSKKARECS
ncbi:bromodomain-containing protein 8-like [Anthonomus grandis grandis]|uniref:bromodomain-containing protein 8-like n=1 Tax=Anthonomus grandis grandis TaxID=2921223 RepID=UPI00216677C7|nr:bromodomain-containing protein 8-like [Anthonomus grandis grandis]